MSVAWEVFWVVLAFGGAIAVLLIGTLLFLAIGAYLLDRWT